MMLGASWHKSRKHFGKVFSDIFCPCFWLEVGRNLLARKKEATCKSIFFLFPSFFSRQNKTRRKRKREEAGNEFRNCFWGREATVCVCVCGIWGTQKNSEQTLGFLTYLQNLFCDVATKVLLNSPPTLNSSVDGKRGVFSCAKILARHSSSS